MKYGPYQNGDIVQTMFNNGLGGTILFGIVEEAGTRRFTVRWESDLRNRFEQTYHLTRASFHVSLHAEENAAYEQEIRTKLEEQVRKAKEKKKRR